MTTLRNDSLVRERKTERIEGGEEKRKKKMFEVETDLVGSSSAPPRDGDGYGRHGMAWQHGCQGYSRVFKGVQGCCYVLSMLCLRVVQCHAYIP